MTRPDHTPDNPAVFVFGSNLAGIHGAGAALYASRDLGAVRTIGEGPMPEPSHPRCYALPTKGRYLRPLPLIVIGSHVWRFLRYAHIRDDLRFYVSPVGCGLAGYTAASIAPMFVGAPSNCDLPEGWR